MVKKLVLVFSLVVPSVAGVAGADGATPERIVASVARSDSWGLGGAVVNARAVVTEKSGAARTLVFDAKSREYAPPLGKSIISFQAPADVAGMRFLQIQSSGADDERFLYTPDAKRARRVAASSRADSFMGTDFTYADLDERDLRQSAATGAPDERVGKFDCHHVFATPTNADAVYAKIELWVRKDNLVPLRWVMTDKKGAKKTLVAQEIQRHGDRWFITRSRMVDAATGRATELTLEKVDRKTEIPLDSFTIRAFEKG